MKNVTYQSQKFNEQDIVSTYALFYSDGDVKFFDVNLKHHTIREFFLPAKEVPPEIAAKNPNGIEQVLISGLTAQERIAYLKMEKTLKNRRARNKKGR